MKNRLSPIEIEYKNGEQINDNCESGDGGLSTEDVARRTTQNCKLRLA